MRRIPDHGERAVTLVGGAARRPAGAPDFAWGIRPFLGIEGGRHFESRDHSDRESLSSTVPDKICVAFVVAGDTHTCDRRADGSILSWGDNRFGQLGTGDKAKRASAKVALGPLSATRVFLPAGDGDITSDLGAFACAITTDNELSCWVTIASVSSARATRSRAWSPRASTASMARLGRRRAARGTLARRRPTGDSSAGEGTRHASSASATSSHGPRRREYLPVAVDRLSAGATFRCAPDFARDTSLTTLGRGFFRVGFGAGSSK